MTQTKKTLSKVVSKRMGKTYVLCYAVVNAFIDELQKSLLCGDRVYLRNVGMFKTVFCQPTFYKDPRYGTRLPYPSHKRIKFRESKVLKRILRPKVKIT